MCGCKDCRGLLTLAKNGEIRTNVDYYAVGHSSAFVPRGYVKNGEDVNDILKQGFIHETKCNFGSISCKWLCYSGRSYGAWQMISISLNPKLPKSIKRSVICSRRSFRNNLAPYFVRKLFVQKCSFILRTVQNPINSL